MKAMIFAAGLGTRLRPLTNDRPKALVTLAGKTMLERVISRVRDAGFDDITVNVHHFADMVIDYLERNNGFGCNIHISDEREKVLETGGGILAARQWLDGDEPFLVHNADILTDIDLNAMYHAHCQSDAMATVLVKNRSTKRYFVFDGDMKLHGWVNVETGETRPETFDYQADALRLMAFGGVHVISPSIFPLLDNYAQQIGDNKFSTTPFYVAQCRTARVMGYAQNTPYNWFDVGKPETLSQAEQFLASE